MQSFLNLLESFQILFDKHANMELAKTKPHLSLRYKKIAEELIGVTRGTTIL